MTGAVLGLAMPSWVLSTSPRRKQNRRWTLRKTKDCHNTKAENGVKYGATTLSITTLSIKGLLTTLSINDTQHNNTVIRMGVCVSFVAMLCVLIIDI